MTPLDTSFLEQLTVTGDGAPSLEDKLELAASIRNASPAHGRVLDQFLLEETERLRGGFEEARESQNKLKELLEGLTASPWHVGIYLGAAETSRGPMANVAVGPTRRLVGLAHGIEVGSLAAGQEVFLTSEMNAIVEKSVQPLSRVGQTACFERTTPDGRAVLNWRDEEVVVDMAEDLREVELEQGDLVRWDRSVWMAFEKIESPVSDRYLIGEVPDTSPDLVGGQEENLALLLSVLTARLISPQKARQYGLNGRESVLMFGPPGCGKTLMARAAATEIGRISGKRSHFSVVKPGQWEDPFVGVTQANIRRTFAALAQAAEDGPAILFLDEIESIGRIRGSSISGHHSDKFLAALLAELDGFADRSGMAIVAATNRKDLVDPALLERLSAVEIQVDRPDVRAARAIFGIHFLADLPYTHNGSDREVARREMIETAVSCIYSPNGRNKLCQLRFRDGRTRDVSAGELASGRVFEQVCRASCRTAFVRDTQGGEPGITIDDVEHAVTRAIDRLRTTLTLANCRSYLTDLPQDVDVVSVAPVTYKVAEPRRYLTLQPRGTGRQ